MSMGPRRTPAITTRELREERMPAPAVAAWMDDAITASDDAITASVKDDEPALERIASEVHDLLRSFPTSGLAPGE